MANNFPDEVEETMDPAETGRSGCLIPQTDTDEGHCDAAGEEEDSDAD